MATFDRVATIPAEAISGRLGDFSDWRDVERWVDDIVDRTVAKQT